MTRAFRLTKIQRGAAAMLTLLVLASAAPASAVDDKNKPKPAPPNISGRWRLNKSQSDDPREKMRQAMSRGDFPGGPGGGGPGGRPHSDGFPGGPPPGAEGGGFPGGPPPGGRPPGGMAAAEALEIVQGDGELTINETGSSEVVRTRTINTDGRKSEQSTPGGRAEVKGKWKGTKLVVEIKPERGGKLTETYELAPSGGQLYVTTKIENERLPQAVSIRRVYDRGE